MTRTVTRTCPLCEATCGLRITLDGDRVTDVRGDKDDVFSRGFICPKGAAMGALHHDPDRLRSPLVKQPDGTFAEVSWEDAFTRVHEGLNALWDKHDRTALASYLGNPTLHNMDGTFYVKPLLLALRSHHIYTASTVDQMPKHVSSGWMYGDPLMMPVPDLDRTDWLLMLGANPHVSNGSICTAPDFPGRMRAIRKRGGKVICVDPRRSRSAAKSDEHVAIRPGGDAFLLMAMAHVLFAEDKIDLGRLAEHVNGLDELRAIAADWTPERVEARTGLDAATIRRLALEFAGAEAPAIYGRIGTCTQRHGTLASWLVDALMVLRGRLDAPGGAMWPTTAHSKHRPDKTPGGRGWNTGRWRSRVRKLKEIRGELPVATMVDEMETPGRGQVRGLLTVAGNPVLSTPNGPRLEAALADLEFMVSVDPYLNETTRYADVILPPPSPMYRSAYHLAFYDYAVRNVAHYQPAPLPLPEGQRTETEIFLRLGAIANGLGPDADVWALDDKIMAQAIKNEVRGAGSPVEGRDPKELMAALGDRKGPDRALDFRFRVGPYGDHFGATPDGITLDTMADAPHGVDFGPMVPKLPNALKTASGKVELCPKQCADGVAEMAADADAADSDGLVLVGRRTLRTSNSWMHNLPPLVAGKPRCTLHIHPDDATRAGLTDGGQAEVASRVGALTIAVEVTDTVRPGVVSIPHGWGHGAEGARLSVAAAHPGVNTNRLTDELAIDPLSGNAVLSGIPVTVGPA